MVLDQLRAGDVAGSYPPTVSIDSDTKVLETAGKPYCMAYREELLSYVCDATQYLKAITTLMIFFGILSVLSLLLGEPGTAPYVLSVINFVIAAVSIVAALAVFWYCRSQPDAY